MSTGSNLVISNTPGCIELAHKNSNFVDLLNLNSIIETTESLVDTLLSQTKLESYQQYGLAQRQLIKERHGPEKQLSRLLSLFQNYS